MRTRRKITTLVAAVFAALALAVPASALGAPELEVSSSHYPGTVPADTYARFELIVANTGNASTSSDVSLEFALPVGLKATSVTDTFVDVAGVPAWACTIAGDSQSVSCTGPSSIFGPIPIEAGKEACQEFFGFVPHCRLIIWVKADEDATPGTVNPAIHTTGGGSADFNGSDPIEIGPPAQFELASFDGEVLEESGDAATQAGSTPYTAGTVFTLATVVGATKEEFAAGQLKDASVKLPSGLVGNPLALPTCTQAQLNDSSSGGSCPAESRVGTVNLHFGGLTGTLGHPQLTNTPVFNMELGFGTPGLFAFNYLGTLVEVYVRVRTGEDYGVTVIAKNAAQTLPLEGVTFTFWGVPAEAGHDAERGGPSEAPLRPLINLPTACVGSVETFLDVTSWEESADSSSFLSHAAGEPENLIGSDGCSGVAFEPAIEARPTTNVADSASGLDVDLEVPQAEETCEESPTPPPAVLCPTATAHLRDTTVTLPEGLVINPAGANGLDGCSEAEFGYTETGEDGTVHTTPDPANCPEAAKQGTVEVDSPLLDHPLKGAVYLADPYANPFGSLLAIYLAVDDPRSGTVVKLAGEVEADPSTGQLTTTFKQNPQLPFEHFKLHFFGGAGGALRTPATCGTYTTESSLTPWSAPESGPPASPEDTWAIQTAPGGGTCPTSDGARANSPDLDAGSVSPISAIATPTVVTLRRDDGTQEFSTVNLTLPPGLTGRLAGVEQCSDGALASAASKSGNEEKSSPSCPANSRIGRVDVAAGAGPGPYHTEGTAYLAGRYKGAPLSMAIVTPATAGPFDLGTVVVRVALFLDRNTGQITAVSDQIPHILQGIPLDIREARILLDRDDFTRNGTSCDPSSFEGNLVSTLNQSVALSERFQLGECGRLALKPKLGIRLFGGTKRGAHPRLRGVLVMPEGGANIAKASVALPHSEFLDQGHIGTVCTRVQFAAKECPAASIYGNAVATSPLVDYTLEGPAYLRSSSHKLPDLVVALHGPPSQPIEVDVVGRIDSVRGGIRTTFEGVPDLPVSKFVLNMQGGRKGLLQNSTNVCRGKHRVTAEFDGQNGKVADLTPLLKNGKCRNARRKKRTRKHRRHARASALNARRAVR